MSKSGREIYECVQTLAQQGHNGHTIADIIASIFTIGMPIKKRIALAWKVIRG